MYQLNRAFINKENSEYDRLVALDNLKGKVSGVEKYYTIEKTLVDSKNIEPLAHQVNLTIYTDKDGKQIRRPATMENPDNLTSQMYKDRLNPGTGDINDHNGTDYSMERSTKLGSVMEMGKVTKINENPINFLNGDSGGAKDLGANVEVVSEGTDPIVRVLYNHLSMINVSEGQTVRMGDFIGRVGNSGNSTNDHLHFMIYVEVGKKASGEIIWKQVDNETFDWNQIKQK